MKLKTPFINLIFLFTICSNLYAQISKKEVELLKKSVTHYANTNTDSLIYFAKKLQGSNYIGDQLEGLSAESKAYYQLKDYSKSEFISNQILNTPNINSYNLNDQLYIKRKKIIAYNRLFWIEINRENYNKAYSHILEAEKLNTEFLSNSDIYYRYRLNIETSKALIKSKLNMHDEAKNILLNINTEIESSNIDSYEDYNAFSIQKANVLNSLGNSYLALYNQNQNKTHIDSAAIFFDKAYNVSKTFDPPHKDSKIIYSLRKTEVLMAKEEYKKAINLINTYTRINKEFDSEHFQYFQKAICFYNLKNIDSTLYFSNRFLTTKRDKCKPSSLITIYDILSNQYYALNKVDSAYKYSTLTLKEFNHAKKNKDKTFQLLYKNDFAKASALNKSIIQKESNRKNIQMLFYVLSLLVLFSIFFYLQKNKNQKKVLKTVLAANDSTPIKKVYNIDKNFEKEILNKLTSVEASLSFLNKDFSIKSLAKDLETNSTYLSYILNKEKGKSFKLYYTELRLNYLINKLKTDSKYRKYTIQSLGNEIGYTNASAFTRAFKKHIGMTPSAYIKSLS